YQDGEFCEFPKDFYRDYNHLIEFSRSAKDAFGVLEIGQEYYFVAASEITDSAKTKEANGTMLIGKQIDEDIINSIEKNLDCSLNSISIVKDTNHYKGQAIRQQNLSYSNEDSIILTYLIPYAYDENSSVQIILTKDRDMYRFGMKNVAWFAFFDTILFLLIAAVVFYLLNKFLSKPFIKLFNDIVSINLNEEKSKKLPEEGKHEFLSLRLAVNKMLERIDTEQSKVRQNEEKLLATLLSVGDGVITVDVDKKIQFMNPIAQQLTGWTNEEAIGQEVYNIFQIKDGGIIQDVEKSAKEKFELKEIFRLNYQTVLISRDGMEKYIDLTIAPIKDKYDSRLGVVIVFRDFSEKREKQERIRYLSYHDQLTDLYNRRFFEEELARLDTPENLPISFLYADVNGLKFINDAFGHESGDQMIIAVANILKETCRDGIIARIGGDEFIVILPKADNKSLEKLANRIQEKVNQITVNNIDLNISLGWDTKNREFDSAMIAIKNAEDSMYQKKLLSSNSKSNVVIQTILNTLLIKNPREKAHSQRVGLLCKMIGKAYNLNDDQIKELETAGELHDIGKIILDEAILNKSGKLTEFEMAQIRKHPETGYRLLGNSNEFYKISEFVLDHHENWDGTGYPKGLKGEAIHWQARVISIADSYDAMTSERPYKNALSESEAVEEIKKYSGIQFDPDISIVFVEKVLGVKW
ncbi:MAG TPA: HD domain-containing phosphohydrolase, partial [Anaerovoracaceae bacterium]|nr:HD domain-containing phosphohydrolase [Anaerovoracaceae bacterium]